MSGVASNRGPAYVFRSLFDGDTVSGVKATQRVLLGWFDANGRDFPWRRTRDPYATMVAEVMLQQTQTSRVVPAFSAFLKRFPTVDVLACAPAADVITQWHGLGYNRRAVALHRAAQAIVNQHNGRVPADPATLATLPGIGAYTSHAIACFAYNVQVPVVDVNVTRVLSRVALGLDPANVGPARVAQVARDWLPDGSVYEWNQALMDVGSSVCRAGIPRCDDCPIRQFCAFRREGLHRTPLERASRRSPRFEGSRRQLRGRVVAALRGAPGGAMTVAALRKVVDSGAHSLEEVLAALHNDGLVVATPAARRGSLRGVVGLPG